MMRKRAPSLSTSDIFEEINRLGGGRHPFGLMDWIHILGKRNLSLRSVDAGPGFEGVLRGNVVYVPRGCNEDETVKICSHEFSHYLLRERTHEISRAVQNRLSDLSNPLEEDEAMEQETLGDSEWDPYIEEENEAFNVSRRSVNLTPVMQERLREIEQEDRERERRGTFGGKRAE